MTYDVLIIGGGPGGIYTAWELLNKRPDLKLALFESGHTLERRRCPPVKCQNHGRKNRYTADNTDYNTLCHNNTEV